MKPGPMLYAGALLLIFHCARRKPDMVVMNGIDIALLDIDNAWNNYTDAMHHSLDAKCVAMRERYKSVAMASLETYFRRLECDPRLMAFYEFAHGARWDNRKGIRRG